MKCNMNYHVVYASDDNFAEILGVSMVSLYENNKNAEDITFYILDNKISHENKKNIEDICKKYKHSTPVWITAINIEEKLHMRVKLDRGSLSQYARLFISSLLPSDLERVLYLDCDIIVNQSIEELWNLDLQGNTIAALMDAFSKHYRANIGLRPKDIMFNSGVMLIDLTKWKEHHIEDKLMNFIKRNHGKIQQGDQGVLNAVLSRETYCFEPHFNSVTIFYDFTYEEMLIYRKPPEFYQAEKVKKAVEEPVIIHFTTSFLSKRPWIDGCEHRYKDKWFQYRVISPWKNAPIRVSNSSKWKHIGLKLYITLPQGLALRIVGIMQAYGRPLKNKLIK